MQQLPAFTGCGAAFLLRTPAKETITWQHENARISIREGATYLTVTFDEVTRPTAVRDTAWTIAQEVLDIQAVVHRNALATHKGDSEYLVWTQGIRGQHLTVADLFSLAFSAKGTITHGDSNSPSMYLDSPNSTSFPTIAYHPAFRFYRLSQLTDDLFDAFRNAYLCLECLVSETSAKWPNEGESAWLKRVLAGELGGALPDGVNPAPLVDEIYRLVRLPLFHAKAGESFFMPYTSGRDEVHAVLIKLNALLMWILRHKFGPILPGGWGTMNDVARDSVAKELFQFNAGIFKCDEREAPVSVSIDIVDQPRRFENLWARIHAQTLPPFASISGLELCLGCQGRLSLTFPERLPLIGLESFTVELGFSFSHSKAPRSAYPQ